MKSKIFLESIQYLINISDMLEIERRKSKDLNSTLMYEGQKYLCGAIERFKEVQKQMKKIEKSRILNQEERV
jgi:hypothetical protein